MTNTPTITTAPRPLHRPLAQASDFKPLTRITDPARNRRRGKPAPRKVRVHL